MPTRPRAPGGEPARRRRPCRASPGPRRPLSRNPRLGRGNRRRPRPEGADLRLIPVRASKLSSLRFQRRSVAPSTRRAAGSSRVRMRARSSAPVASRTRSTSRPRRGRRARCERPRAASLTRKKSRRYDTAPCLAAIAAEGGATSRVASDRPGQGSNRVRARSRHDRGRESDQALRPAHGRGRHLLQGRTRARSSASWAPTARARPRPCASSPATCPPPRARRGWPASTCSSSRWR